MKKKIKPLFLAISTLAAGIFCMGVFIFASDDEQLKSTHVAVNETIRPEIKLIDFPNHLKKDQLIVFQPYFKGTNMKNMDFEWQVNGQTVSHARNFTYVFKEQGTYKVSLKVENDLGQDVEQLLLIVQES